MSSVADTQQFNQTVWVRKNWPAIIELTAVTNKRIAAMAKEGVVLRVNRGVITLAFKAKFHANSVAADPDVLLAAILEVTSLPLGLRTVTINSSDLREVSTNEADYQNALRLAFEAGRAYERATRAELEELDATWHPDLAQAGQIAIRAAKYGPGRDLVLDDPLWPPVRVPGRPATPTRRG